MSDIDDLAWPSIRSGIVDAIASHRTPGVTCSFGDWRKDVNGIAGGFDPGNGGAAMALNVGGPACNLSKAFPLDAVRPRLIEVIRQPEVSFPR